MVCRFSTINCLAGARHIVLYTADVSSRGQLTHVPPYQPGATVRQECGNCAGSLRRQAGDISSD